MKIGYIADEYPERRCIIDKTSNCSYINIKRKYFDPHYIITKIYTKLARKSISWDSLEYYNPIHIPTVDIVHTFNHVCDVKEKWVVTFESTVPRTNATTGNNWRYECANGKKFIPRKLESKCFELLQKENCIGIIALSEAALRLQNLLLDSIDKNAYVNIDSIKNKTVVIHPPQTVLVSKEDIHRKFKSMESLKFLLVGADFFRKGGAELIDVLQEYRLKDARFTLTVVSKLQYGDYASGATAEEYDKYRDILLNSDWITWYESLPNDKVLELAKESHIGCLPTLADTYGYSVLELQACGCCVITTDIRALPEINNDECGWVCHLPKDDICGEAIYTTAEDKKVLRKTLKQELKKSINEIFEHPELLEKKALNSRDRIIRDHDPDKYAEKLMKIYKK